MKTRATALAVCMVLLLCMNSCTQSDLPEPSSGHYRVRLYDDTLPDPRSHSIHIAAGDGRLLMTYGHTFEQMVMLAGNLTLPPPSVNVYMLTDNEGNLLRKEMLPTGLTVADVVTLPDNSFLLVLNTGVPELWGGPEWSLHFMRIDPNGAMGPEASLNAPTNHPQPYQQIRNIRLCPLPNGHALLYYYYTGADNGSAQFVGEMDTEGSFLWHKEFESLTIDDLAISRDGGYMVSAGIWNPVLQTSEKFIMKMNSSFDSSWSSSIVPAQGAVGNFLIASKSNGNFWLTYAASHDGKSWYHVLDMNAEGEIVDSSSYPLMINLQQYNMTSVISQHGASGLFISHSLIMGSFNESVSNRFNTMYVTLDANLNIINKSVFQDQTSDMLNSGCRTSDGRIACFGLTQGYHRWYYKPELIIIN